MGMLQAEGNTVVAPLPSRCRVGRAPDCDLTLPDRAVSGEHAAIMWRRDHWVVRDLGSRNGTFVDGRRVRAGEDLELALGAQLAFGSPRNGWRLVDLSAPGPCATRLRDGLVVSAAEAMLELPGAMGAPEAAVFVQGESWTLETERSAWSVQDGDVVDVEGVAWRLALPSGLAVTADAARPPLGQMAARFGVSADEEWVELTLSAPDARPVTFESRAHIYTLLTLARARLEDLDRSDLSAADHGWRHSDDLAQMLRLDRLVVNTHVARARRQVAKAGLRNAAAIVERRIGTGQLRFGLADVCVERL